MDERMHFERILLPVAERIFRYRADHHRIPNANINVEKFMDDIIVTMIQRVAKEPDAKPITISYPNGWVQAVKERWLPKFLLKRFPVKYWNITVTATTFYPNLTLPDEKPFYEMHRVDKETVGSWWR